MYQFSKVLNVVIKPTLACNLRCKYCYYQHTDYNKEKMSTEILSRFCDISFPYFKKMLIIWHGGEPTLYGKNTLLAYIDIVNKKSKQYSLLDISQSVQTNGTLLNDNFVKCLKAANVSIGISYDGLKNSYLRNGTDKVLKSIRMIQENNLTPKALSVVSGINYKNLIDEYENAKKLGIDVKYSPYEDVDSPLEQIKISSDQYVECMERLFDYWIDDKNCCIRLEPFCGMIRDYYKGKSSTCTRTSCMQRWIGINPNGDVFPCGRFMNIKPYGNINNLNDIREIYHSESYVSLLKKANIRKKKCFDECDVFQFCEGGCNYDAALTSGIENNSGFDCRIFKNFFKYVMKVVDSRDLFKCFKNVKNPMLSKFLEGIVTSTVCQKQ
ncbi:MAG: radical SAM protein [Clostridia bacterium]|nr:radical SAM protein [Clostridia bacterium]